MAKEEKTTDADQQQEQPAAEDQPAEQPEGDEAAPAEGDVTEVQQAELPEADESAVKSRGGQIDILLDTSMPVEIRLGEVEMEVRDLLQVGPGSIITLDKQAGEPLDLYLKGVRFATGQLVIAGEKLGLRITEILSAAQTDAQTEPKE